MRKKILPIQLGAAYPDPFLSVSTLPFSLRESGQVCVTIYKRRNQKRFLVLEAYLQPGRHRTIIIKEDLGLSPGSYLYELSLENANGRYRQHRRLTVTADV